MQDIWNRDNCRMRFVRYIGQHSLEIYLLHFFFLPTLLWLKPLKEDALNVEFPIVFSLALILIWITLCLNFILTRSEYVLRLLYGK